MRVSLALNSTDATLRGGGGEGSVCGSQGGREELAARVDGVGGCETIAPLRVAVVLGLNSGFLGFLPRQDEALLRRCPRCTTVAGSMEKTGGQQKGRFGSGKSRGLGIEPQLQMSCITLRQMGIVDDTPSRSVADRQWPVRHDLEALT